MEPLTKSCHRWSPLHELTPQTPLRHGHAISIDMAYSATLANNRKLITDTEHFRILNLFSRAGLSMDHHQFDEEMLAKGTAAIMKTRDGKLRAAVPSPIGTCTFLNDVSASEMNDALRRHKHLMQEYPRQGEGLEAYVDSSDTGYTENGKEIEATVKTNGVTNGVNGHKFSNEPSKSMGVDSAGLLNRTNGIINHPVEGVVVP